jgi:hypothetical protein
MTQAKKLKKAIRTRAKKTGERYAAARRQVLAARDRRAARKGAAPRSAANAAARASATGGAGDARVRARTGHSLDHWFEVLDRFGATQKGHTATARHLVQDHGVDGWYAQSITVAFERARGLRSANQRMSGHFEVSISKVVDAPLERVAEALTRPAERAAWLCGSDPALQKGLRDALSAAGARTVKVRAGKDAYVRYPAGGNTIEIRVLAKPGGRASVVATVMKVTTAAAKEAQRAAWRQALEGLKVHLAG